MSIKTTALLLLLALGSTPFSVYAQRTDSFLDGKYTTFSDNSTGKDIQFFVFSRKSNKIKAKYFAQNAPKQFKKWKEQVKPNILMITVGAYSTSFNDMLRKPLGLTVDNGKTVNRNLEEDQLDALVVVYNGGSQKGGIGIVNLDTSPLKVNQGEVGEYWVKNSFTDRQKAISWAETQGATLFQAHLLYDKNGTCFPDNYRYKGKTSERRYLAVTMKDGVAYHIVADIPSSEYFNSGGEKVAEILKTKGYKVFGVINLDVGGYNLMQAFDDKGNVIRKTSHPLSNTTNLIVWYH
ncbi:MAG: hypothetical protein AAFO69_00525 [Bacteroidota bacterium]